MTRMLVAAGLAAAVLTTAFMIVVSAAGTSTAARDVVSHAGIPPSDRPGPDWTPPVWRLP